MNILFLTLLDFQSLDEKNIYTDLLREFIKNDHYVAVISPTERRRKEKTHLIKKENYRILKLRIGNIQKTNIIEKGVTTIMIESLFIKAVKKYFGNIKFDLVLYSTPPITFQKTIAYVKKRDNAKTYLLLKDIFPQNAVDLGILSKKGLKKILYHYFRRKEKKLYNISDKIGCMSEANIKYVYEHNPQIQKDKVELCPNSIEVVDKSIDKEEKTEIRKRYGLPLDKTIFVYGGNLGKPQGIDFLIECLKTFENDSKSFFLIVGMGTEYGKIKKYLMENKPTNMKLMKSMPKEEYEKMIASCDVGLIFLNHNFTIPNFPSRLLAYMQAKLPVLAATDPNTDIGKVIEENNFGWWCKSNSVINFRHKIREALEANKSILGMNAYVYLEKNYNVIQNYDTIMKM
mgnify:CR=1 FL=1